MCFDMYVSQRLRWGHGLTPTSARESRKGRFSYLFVKEEAAQTKQEQSREATHHTLRVNKEAEKADDEGDIRGPPDHVMHV